MLRRHTTAGLRGLKISSGSFRDIFAQFFVDNIEKRSKKKMAGPIMDAAVLTYDGISFVPSESYLDFSAPAWVLGKHFIIEDGTYM